MAGPITTDLISAPAPPVFPVALFAPTPKAAQRALEFCTAQLNNDHTRKAHLNATLCRMVRGTRHRRAIRVDPLQALRWE